MVNVFQKKESVSLPIDTDVTKMTPQRSGDSGVELAQVQYQTIMEDTNAFKTRVTCSTAIQCPIKQELLLLN